MKNKRTCQVIAGEFQRRRTITLSDNLLAKAKLLGKGNASAGIRLALESSAWPKLDSSENWKNLI